MTPPRLVWRSRAGSRCALDLPYAHQQIDDADVDAVIAALRSDWLTDGPRVPAFEAGLEDATGARHAVTFSSGTAALHGATPAAGLGPGDERSRRRLTFVATANAVLYVGAEVRFADVDPGLAPDRARTGRGAVRRGPGRSCPSTTPAAGRLRRAARDRRRRAGRPAYVIADAAHSLGAT